MFLLQIIVSAVLKKRNARRRIGPPPIKKPGAKRLDTAYK